MTEYQVVAEMAAHVEVQELGGTSIQTFYKGAYLPDGVPAKRIRSLLDAGIIAEAGEVPIAPNAAVDQDPARGLDSVTPEVLQGEKPEEPREDPALASNTAIAESMTGHAAVDKAVTDAPVESFERQAAEKDQADAEQRREEARAKLAEIGGTPDGRSSDAVMVEYLVGRGYDRSEVEKADRAELKGLVAAAK